MDRFVASREAHGLVARLREVSHNLAPGGAYFAEEVATWPISSKATLLSGATAPTVGEAVNVSSFRRHTVHCVVSGAPISLSVEIQGSVNGGSDWFTVHTFTATGFAIIDVPCELIRAVVAALTGTGSVSVHMFSVA